MINNSNATMRRRLPKQLRSIKKVELILDSAARLMARGGNQKITTHQIAKEADIAVGSIYQFFKNVEAIKIALVERVMGQFNDAVLVTLESSTDLNVQDLSDQMVDATLDFYHQYPDIVQTIVVNRNSEAFQQVNRLMNEREIQALIAFVSPQMESLSPEEIENKIRILVGLGDMMTQMVWSAETAQQRTAFIKEWKLMARNYLQDL